MDVGVRIEFDDALTNNIKSIKNGGWIQDVLKFQPLLHNYRSPPAGSTRCWPSWRSPRGWGSQLEGRSFRRSFVLAHLARPLLQTRSTRTMRGRRPELLPRLWPCRPWARRRLWRQLRCHQVPSRSVYSHGFALSSRSRSWSNLHVSMFLGGVVRLNAHPHRHVVAGGLRPRADAEPPTRPCKPRS